MVDSPSSLTADLDAILAQASDMQLAKWWCMLNSKEAVPELPGADPWPTMTKIMDRIGFKACLREWNRDNMDDEQFETFWRRRT